MGVPARAAVEAPEGGRASENGAQPRPDISERRRLRVSRGNGWHCAFRRFASLLLQGASLSLVRGSRQSSGA